jgi:hypothetical protein
MEDPVKKIIEKKKEDSVISIFQKRVEKIGRSKGKEVITSPLNSQDRELGADFFISEFTKFSIFEFKYQENDIKSENEKDLRKILCQKLQENNIRRNQHKECHFIAWSTKDSNPDVELNIYCEEVCNNKILSELSLFNDLPVTKSRQLDVDFIKEFYDGSKGLQYDTFLKYINWLLTIAGVDSGRFELLFEHPNENIIFSVPIKSLDELKKWLIDNKPAPIITYSSKP